MNTNKIVMQSNLQRKMYPTYFVVGALLFYVALYVLPGLLGIGYSFTNWSANNQALKFVGLENYKIVFSGDENYLKYLGNTLTFTFVTTIAKNIIGLALALLLTKRIFMCNVHRGMMYMPVVLSTLIVGMIFKSILNPRVGLLNMALSTLGIKGSLWLINPDIAFWSVMSVDIWKGTGYIMTILIAGIMSIPKTYYEASGIDGANAWQQFRAITLPMIMPTLTVTTVLNIIYGLKVFDIVYALTNGGPGYATEVVNTGIYKEYGFGRWAVGSTLASILFVLMIFVGYFLIKMMNKNEVED